MNFEKKHRYAPFLLIIILTIFFILLYYFDNKYKAQPPYGRNGIITITEADIIRDKPIFLVSGWLLSDQTATNQPTYIGEFSNLQRNSDSSPHGTAVYHQILRYSGNPIEVSIHFPQLFTHHIITFDGQTLSEGTGAATISFRLISGDHLLTVQTTSSHGFYSGMYHPPILNDSNQMFAFLQAKCFLYGIAFFVPLVLAFYTLTLWLTTRDKITFWFGLLCCSFSLYIFYFFVREFHLPFNEYWFLVQSASLYSLCFCTIQLTVLINAFAENFFAVLIRRISVIISLLLLLLACFIPAFPSAIRLHGILTDLYYIFHFCCLLFLLLQKSKWNGWVNHLTLLGCTTFGIGLLLNLFFSNYFEPILFFWQFEWCALLLVILFGAMMAARNKYILQENNKLQSNLEELVEQRTEELTRLLQERKSFFADMAHDLKAPIFATRAFINAIRQNNTGVDGELLYYIDLAEQKQEEMAQRLQNLTKLNQINFEPEPRKLILINDWLENAYHEHHMAAEVASIHLRIILSDKDGFIFGQPQKLNILLENLIYNSIRATPPGGNITLSAKIDKTCCHLIIADTGHGISLTELPHIFERYFVGMENKKTGSGLGLFIVKSIVNELHGDISVSSKPNQGTVFYIDLPLSELPIS